MSPEREPLGNHGDPRDRDVQGVDRRISTGPGPTTTSVHPPRTSTSDKSVEVPDLPAGVDVPGGGVDGDYFPSTTDHGLRPETPTSYDTVTVYTQGSRWVLDPQSFTNGPRGHPSLWTAVDVGWTRRTYASWSEDPRHSDDPSLRPGYRAHSPPKYEVPRMLRLRGLRVTGGGDGPSNTPSPVRKSDSTLSLCGVVRDPRLHPDVPPHPHSNRSGTGSLRPSHLKRQTDGPTGTRPDPGPRRTTSS